MMLSALVSPPVSAQLVVVVEPVNLLPGHEVGQDELGLYGHHGHRLEGEEDALAGHGVPGTALNEPSQSFTFLLLSTRRALRAM